MASTSQLLPSSAITAAEIQGLILTAYDAKVVFYAAKTDKDAKDVDLKVSLTMSALRRSRIAIPKDFPSVRLVLQKSTDWKEVLNIGEANDGLRTFQGKMPDSLRAFAAYTTVADLYKRFGPEGTKHIAVNKGRNKPTEFFLSVPFEVETKDITVNLIQDDKGDLTFLNFWAGIAHKSVIDVGVDDVSGQLVHCNNPPLCH